MRKTILLPLLVVALLAVGLTGVVAKTRSPKEQISRNLDIFTTIVRELQTSYVDTINSDQAIRRAIDAMLDGIDPYTEYISDDQTEDFAVISSGEYGGIGAYISERDGKMTYISEPQAGSPALKAGLRAGDIILAIDGDSMTRLGSDKVRERLRGEAGTTFRITVRRPRGGGRADTVMGFDVRREKIEIQTVPFSGVVRDSIGYISLTTFNEKSAPLVREAVERLTADPRVKAIALDLRGNGGGIMEGAVKVASVFLPKGSEVLRTRGREAIDEKVYKTVDRPVNTEIPLMVLVDGGSASSSEIVAGSLQDHDRAVIVGNRSYGKGLVQSSRQLPARGLLKLTIAKYYLPSGRLIQAIDYSRRNPDGSVARIPDSLTNVFRTTAGREVRDGGGITPDVEVKYGETNRLVYNIVRNLLAFDFATAYADTHATAPAPSVFEIDDSTYEEFKRSVDPARLNYDKVCEILTDRLEEGVKQEGYMSDSVAAAIADLRKFLRHDLNHDLDYNRKQISTYLTNEIMSRYYQQAGSVEASLRTDAAIDSVAAIMSRPGEVARLLGAGAKKSKK